MLKKAAIGLLFILFVKFSYAQEFLCNVQIQHQQIAGVDPSVFEAMEKSIFEFMNNRKWSEINYQIEERIECTMIFTIQGAAQGGDEFTGTLNVVLQRPGFNTDYNSVVINLVDNDISFKYTPYQNMVYADNTFTENLTQLLAFYAYLMIGLDLDTFSLFGGTMMLEKAMTVVQTAQNSGLTGWQVFDGTRSRYQLIENLINPSYSDLRTLLYEYHIKGIDVMAEDLEAGRTAVTESLNNLKTVYNKRPNLYALQVILEAKRNEIISIYSEAPPSDKVAMINIMSSVDPPNGNKYEAVNK